MWPFKKKIEVKIGQTWQYYRYAKDPFVNSTVVVLAIKQGYVQFKYSGGGNGSSEMTAFRMFYELVKEAPDGNES